VADVPSGLSLTPPRETIKKTNHHYFLILINSIFVFLHHSVKTTTVPGHHNSTVMASNSNAVEMHIHVQSMVMMTVSQKWGLEFVLNILKDQRMDLKSSQ
jgi:hypothetical protein